MTPRSGTATLIHCTANVSVPAGASVADTIGGLFKPPRVACVEPCQAGETSVPAVKSVAMIGNFIMRVYA
jgi:hypothetical protein